MLHTKTHILAILLALPGCAGEFVVDLDEEGTSTGEAGESSGLPAPLSTAGSTSSSSSSSSRGSSGSGGSFGDDSGEPAEESSSGDGGSTSTGSMDSVFPGENCHPLEDECVKGWACLPDLVADIEFGPPDVITLGYTCQGFYETGSYGKVCTGSSQCGNEWTPCLDLSYFPEGDCNHEGGCCSQWCDPSNPCPDPSQVFGWATTDAGLTQTTTDPAAIGYCFVPPHNP